MAASYSSAPTGDAEQTDLGTMWQEALIKYYEECGTDLRTIHPSRFTINHILAEQDHQLLLFNQFRHDKGKLDKLRSLISSNSQIIQGVATHIAEAASAAFPPSAAILTAFNYVLNASKVVSEDYDLIVSFFDIMNSFLERVSMLENRMPNEWQFKKFLINVFSAMLTLSAIARKCRQKGRLSKWAKALIDGSDPKLKAAFDSLHMHLERFESATMLATLKQTMDTAKKVEGIGQDVKNIQVGVEQTLAVSQQNYVLGLETKGFSKDAALTSHEILSVVTRQEDRGAEHAAGLQQVMRALNKMSGTKGGQDAVVDAGSRKSAAIRTLAKLLSCNLDDRTQLMEIETTYVNGTYKWFRDQETYSEFEAGNSRLLSVEAPAGMGKSTLSYTVVKALQDEYIGDSTTSVAFFFFREDVDELTTAARMLRSCAIQVATRDVRYREEVLTDLQLQTGYEQESNEEFNQDHEQLWQQLYKKKFHKKSGRRLVMIVDGVDEAEPPTREFLEEIFREVCSSKDLNIQILYTCDPTVFQIDPDTVPAKTFSLTKEHLLPDMKNIIVTRMKGLSRLRKLSQKTKRKIVMRLTRQADTIRYIDHMLRRLNQIGREKAILRELEALPSSTTDVYRVLLSDCQKSRSDVDIEVLRKFFAWLAYSKKPLSLGAASRLLHFIAHDNNISIDEELDHRLLRLSNSNNVEENDQDDSDSESDKLDDDKVNDTEEYSSEDLEVYLGFQERSLRSYFRPGNSSGDDKLRSAHSSGHAMIIEMLHSILTSEEETSNPAQEHLSSYAAQFWMQHLQEINPDDLSQDELVRTIDALCGILSNRGGSIRKLEEYLQYEGDMNKNTILGGTEEALEKSLKCIQKWAIKATQLPSSSISGGTLAWMRPFARNPKTIYIKIADAHVSNWLAGYNAEWDYLIYRRFLFAHYALYLGRELPAVAQNEPLRKYFQSIDGEKGFNITAESIMTISKAFLHIDMTAQSYRAIGTAMGRANLQEEGLEQLKLGAQNADSPLELFNILAKMADTILTIADLMEPPEPTEEAQANGAEGENNTSETSTTQENETNVNGIEDETKNETAEDTDSDKKHDNKSEKKTFEQWVKEGLEVLNRALDTIAAISPADLETVKVRRTIQGLWFMKAQAELYLNNTSNTVAYCQKAKEVMGDDEGSAVAIVIPKLAKMEEWGKLMEVLRPLRATKYDTYFYMYRYTSEIDRAAKETGQIDYITDLYREGAMLEDLRTWSYTVMHSKWAAFYHEVVGTKDAIVKAKAILNKIIDVSPLSSNITTASFRLANILLEEFRTSHHPEDKLAAYREMQGLVKRVGDMMGSDFDPTQSQNVIPLALMMRRLDAYEYQQSLERMFRGCVQALTDDVAWNDKLSFRALAKTLAVVGLEEDARIAATCQIYITDKEVHNKQRSMSESTADGGVADGADAETDGTDAEPSSSSSGESESSEEQDNDGKSHGGDESDDAASEASEDLDTANGWFFCDGCDQSFGNWRNGPLYVCVYCTEMDLCEKCYDKRADRLSGKLPPDWRVICPAGHKHVKAPAEKWKGLKNGVLKFEDKEVTFHDWLVELKEKKWPEAWERYWDDDD
ncbi:hypothetical protein jhhlp_000822 [Lomentospora prolificans]|uniref:Uncharacterized protein n=1 Tax=Lomentospora prolificans TaxID=41688 RepID=A0A2N3NJL5_9PEZI|nr:hypothetical protein jhhlp_000822 [Lomentospora prolificans]